MQQDKSSFWADIKKYEDQLATSPDSYCFARLSDTYLKVGLLDDALHAARKGVERHPEYLAGQKALATACNAKGLNEECISALRRITDITPEDIESQKLLGRKLLESGNKADALQVFRTALEFAPNDLECCYELRSLTDSVTESEAFSDDDVIDDLEIIDELEVLDEDSEFEEVLVQEPFTSHDPLSTTTIAELYASQGFVDKALDIYYKLRQDNLDDTLIQTRIRELEIIINSSNILPTGEDTAESIHKPTNLSMVDNYTKPEVLVSPTNSIDECSDDFKQASVPKHGIADNALVTLEGWLENIRRIRTCR